MTELFLAWLRGLISTGNVLPFYKTTEWRRVRREVLALDKHECQQCKTGGIYARAEVVHHVNELKRRPDLALSVWEDGGKTRRNLISLCGPCHERAHGHRHQPKQPLTVERW